MSKRPATDYRYNISYITKRPTTCQVKRIAKREPHIQPTRQTQPTPIVDLHPTPAEPSVPSVPPVPETLISMLNEVSGDVSFEIDPPSTHRVFEPLSSDSESEDDSDWEP